jgi:DNA-binding NarL/FixJ family response regulator
MSSTNSDRQRDVSPELIRLLLIDDDPIFRLGLRTALEAFLDLQVVAEADTGTEVVEQLERLTSDAVDLIVLELASDRSNPASLSGLPLCQRLRTEYPNRPILLLTSLLEPRILKSAQKLGINGYCPKGSAIADIVQIIRQLASGQSAWQRLPEFPVVVNPTVRPPSWHNKLRSHGLQQIESTLAVVNRELEKPNLSNVDWLFWGGRRRELLAARWVINQLLPTDVIVVEESGGQDRGALPYTPARRPGGTGRPPEREGERGSAVTPANALSLPQESALAQSTTPFDVTLANLQSSLSNLSGVPLEIDILATEKKRELLYIVLRKLSEILEELRFSQVIPDQLLQMRLQILQDLWQSSVTDFLGKYYTLPMGSQNLEVVNVLLGYAAVVQLSTLDKIPLVVEFLSHQLFETPLMIDGVPYPAQTPEALARAEILLQNLIIQVANGVMQPLLNEFADMEIIKQSFYDRRLMSSREIARFRNNLSWRYRVYQWLNEPQAIFESRYHLFVLTDTGIKQTSIYSPRRRELEQLRGIPLAVSLAFEARDAFAPRLRGSIAWAGKGVVYVLTQVVGRAIGLVVRGVIQGIGSTLQETRFGKNGERGK